MIASELRQKYLNFFVKKGHKIIPNVSLVPENDPTALFISAGMQPLVPYLLGEPHPLGKRLVSCQRCLRTDDIEEVGDSVHHTFFEMLGNWSLGDYGKKEAISWSFEFLTAKEWLGIDKEKLAISVFAGDEDAPFDEKSCDLWLDLGIPQERIAKLPKKNNWWGPAGQTGPCGPDTEMFVWSGKEKAPTNFDPNNPLWVEAWNNVFMEFNKTADGKYEPLEQKNVDTGMGVERTVTALSGLDDDYKTELFLPIIRLIEEKLLPKFSYGKEVRVDRAFRIIADHVKAIVFTIAEGVEPSNKDRGYVIRRLIRRATTQKFLWGDKTSSLSILVEPVIEIYGDIYPELFKNSNILIQMIRAEEEKFNQALDTGMKEWNRWVEKSGGGSWGVAAWGTTRWGEGAKLQPLPADILFRLYESYGLPVEFMDELTGGKIDKAGFEKLLKKHQEISRAGAEKKFAGGLADHSEEVTKLHTATHLLHAALRQVLGEHVRQSGSNITAERLRFDFSHPQKLTSEELQKTEDLVNQRIQENLLVSMETMDLDEAKKSGALGFFAEKYGEKVKVYSIGPSTRSARSGRPFSVEICGGPHVDFTGKLGKFKIIKEEAAAAGVRRVYAILNPK